MRAGILLIVLYWALFTIRAGLQPKVAATDKSTKCPAYYTPETDGLKSPWNLAGGLYSATLHTGARLGNGFAKPTRKPSAAQPSFF